MLTKIIESIKTDTIDYEAILDFLKKTLPNLPLKEELAALKAVLIEQPINEKMLWIMAAFRLEDLLYENLKKDFSKKIDLNFCPVAGNRVSLLRFLARGRQWESIQYVLSNPQKFSEIDWNAAPTEGPAKGVSVFWFLAGGRQWDLIKQILDTSPQVVEKIDWNAMPTEGLVKDISVFWYLARGQQWDLVKQILDTSPQVVEKIDWNAAPTEGPDKGKSVWKLLIKNTQWDFVQLIVANPTFALTAAEQTHSVYDDFLQCADLQQRTRLFKVYFLSNLNPEPISARLSEGVFPYQQSLQTNFEVVATMLNDWDEGNFFETIPGELHRSILKNFLYEIDPDLRFVSWKRLEPAFYDHLEKRRAQLQTYACRAVAWHAHRFFQIKPEKSLAVLPSKATVARWIEEANNTLRGEECLRRPEREQLLSKLKEQPELTEMAVKTAFDEVFCQMLIEPVAKKPRLEGNELLL